MGVCVVVYASCPRETARTKEKTKKSLTKRFECDIIRQASAERAKHRQKGLKILKKVLDKRETLC